MEADHRDHRRYHRPCAAFKKMEILVKEMQDTEGAGVPVRSQKLFLTSVPSAFMGYDLIEWLMERLGIEESEALNLATQLCHYGYFFPVSDSKTLVVKDDSTLYRFQSPYYWPWQNRPPDNIDYAIYLAKRTLRNKQRHGLDDYELDALNTLRKNLSSKWDFITMQAEEQLKLAKVLKKGDKVINDSQERAYWRVHRPPPGHTSSLEQCPVPSYRSRGSAGRTKKRTVEDVRRDVILLRTGFSRTRIKLSQALDSMLQHIEIFMEYDPLIVSTQPSNPWVTDDITYWQLNNPIVDVPTEKRIKRWALNIEELVADPTGLHEFTQYLRKEYSHENIRFWMAVNDLRRSAQSQIQHKVAGIFAEFLAPGAPCEINIDGNTMAKVQQEMKTPNRFTFDAAQEHVYTLLLKNDCYPRFIRSEYYKNLLASGIQPLQKKRFFGFGQPKKKAQSTSNPPMTNQTLQQQPSQGGGSTTSCPSVGAGLMKRRGSDRSLSGSAHELPLTSGTAPKVPHSHSQTNLTDIPHRSIQKKKTANITIVASTSESSRKNSNPYESGDGGSSSSDISATMSEITERVFRTSILTQQQTVDDSSRKKLTLLTDPMPIRRASVSVPTGSATSNNDTAPITTIPVVKQQRKVASFEDTKTSIQPTINISTVVEDFGVVGLKAPLAQPDAESPANEVPPETICNEICPWEDDCTVSPTQVQNSSEAKADEDV